MGDGWLVALGAVVTSVIAGLAGAVAMLWKARDGSKRASEKAGQAREKTAAARADQIIDRLERQISRYESYVEALRREQKELDRKHSRCEARLAELWGFLALFHQHAGHLDRIARAAGEDPGVLPGLPERPDADEEREEKEFAERTHEQTTAILKEIDSKIIPPPATPPKGRP